MLLVENAEFEAGGIKNGLKGFIPSTMLQYF
jgi:hypothetical protein